MHFEIISRAPCNTVSANCARSSTHVIPNARAQTSAKLSIGLATKPVASISSPATS
jgi:hypothetical protein